jgi:exodeoxyribonuclease VII large subunit
MDTLEGNDLPLFQQTLKETVLSVSEFLDLVNDLVKPLKVSVTGEVTSAQQRGNSIYFTISDKLEKAVLNCYMYRSNPAYYLSILKEGAEVELSGSGSIYKPFGKFTLNVSQVTPVGEGALKAAYEALKKELEIKGYFDEERKREIPPFVKKIGLITSEFGDARKDFITHLGNHGLEIFFKDVRVEGMYAVQSISDAIKYMNATFPNMQALVITRGGGSLESLQAFNSLEVSEAIFSSRIPVISAVGHENDITIADLVADVRASTPTHAGKILAEPWLLAQDTVNRIESNILHLFSLATETIEREMTMIFDRALQKFSHNLVHKQQMLSLVESNMFGHFKTVFAHYRELEHMYAHRSADWITFIGKRLDMYDQVLTLSNPEKRLKQGYSITRNQQGRVVKSISQVSEKETLTIQVADGTISSHT